MEGGLQLDHARILHASLLVPVLTYGSEKMLWKEKRSRIRAVQMDNLRVLLGIGGWIKSRMIRELCRVKKVLDER